MRLDRRTLLAGTAALALPTLAPLARAQKAEFTMKFGNNLPITHPLNVSANEMVAKILADTKGRVDIKVFPSSQLGTDTDMLSQLRNGALEFFTLSPLILGTLVPSAQISGVGFAFKDYDQVWAAMDGDLGAHVRKQIAATNAIVAFDKIWDNGYRQMTTSTRPITRPEDLKGMKMRVPPSPFWVSMFKAFDASPTTINFAEVYTALAIVATAKLNEVQKYCSVTNHMWDGFWFLGNKRAVDRLPADLREIVSRHVAEAALKQRAEVRKLNDSLTADLKGKGMEFNDTNAEVFRAKLREARFYEEWKKKFGDDAWALLEKYTGKLA